MCFSDRPIVCGCSMNADNRPVAQITQCTSPISYKAPYCNRRAHVRIFMLQNVSLWDICLMHCGICETDPLVYASVYTTWRSCNIINELDITFLAYDGSEKLEYIDSIVQDCSDSCALTMALLQSWAKKSIWYHIKSVKLPQFGTHQLNINY